MYTDHFKKRCQQRGISSVVVEVLLDFGKRRYRHGADIYFMDRYAREQVRQCLGRREFARISGKLNSYVVIGSDGAPITAAYRHRRLKFK
jgi:hypothetical protein